MEKNNCWIFDRTGNWTPTDEPVFQEFDNFVKQLRGKHVDEICREWECTREDFPIHLMGKAGFGFPCKFRGRFRDFGFTVWEIVKESPFAYLATIHSCGRAWNIVFAEPPDLLEFLARFGSLTARQKVEGKSLDAVRRGLGRIAPPGRPSESIWPDSLDDDTIN